MILLLPWILFNVKMSMKIAEASVEILADRQSLLKMWDFVVTWSKFEEK